MPYWDWASKPVPAPELIDADAHQELIILGAPSVRPVSIPNPLLAYHFQGLVSADFGSFGKFSSMLWYPTDDNRSDRGKMIQALVSTMLLLLSIPGVA